jgi:hypothetical protein
MTRQIRLVAPALAKLRNATALALRSPDLAVALAAMWGKEALTVEDHLSLCAAGLLNASRNSTDGGYSVCYSLIFGWHAGYIETTGYIIPTALDLAQRLGHEELRADALGHGPWLLSHQKSDGSFPGISRVESMAFDTGQVLIGLQRLHLETGEDRYLDAAVRCADWLCAIQDDDGAWTKSGDPAGRSITFLTRTAAALLDFGIRAGDRRYVVAGEKFLEWARKQQLPSGLFRQSELVAGDPYLLHTMMYVLEGYLHAWKITGEEKWLSCAMRGAAPLLKINVERDPLLYSYYDAELRPRSRSMCMTGLSQWAGVCFDLHEQTQEPGYLQCGSNALFYVMTKQIRAAGRLQGAIAGSTPLWGDYLKWAFPNWNIKFFADALLKFERKGMAPPEQSRLFILRMGQKSRS